MEELEKYYQLFADYIVDNIDEEWIKAWIYMEVEDGYTLLAGRYLKENNQEKPNSFRVMPIEDEVVEFWELFNEKPWFSATFTLFENGKFKINYDYNKPSENETIEVKEP